STTLHEYITTKCYGIFFFQAEDGIRDRTVTGVQTCALPIYFAGTPEHVSEFENWLGEGAAGEMNYMARGAEKRANPQKILPEAQIGRASCRERCRSRWSPGQLKKKKVTEEVRAIMDKTRRR